MNEQNFMAEAKAYQAFAALLEHAATVQSLFDAAKLDAPEPLKRLQGLSRASAKGDDTAGGSSSIASHRRPDGIPDDWFSIPVEDCNAHSVVLAVLRKTGGPLAPNKLTPMVSGFLASASYGVVANVGSRQQGKTIERGDDGWKLIDPSSAPVIENKRLWWAADKFSSHELAAHRREIAKSLLKNFTSGLMVLQLVELLRKEPACKAPASKDLVKADVLQMADAGVIKRVGNTKKWTLSTT